MPICKECGRDTEHEECPVCSEPFENDGAHADDDKED